MPVILPHPVFLNNIKCRQVDSNTIKFQRLEINTLTFHSVITLVSNAAVKCFLNLCFQLTQFLLFWEREPWLREKWKLWANDFRQTRSLFLYILLHMSPINEKHWTYRIWNSIKCKIKYATNNNSLNSHPWSSNNVISPEIQSKATQKC